MWIRDGGSASEGGYGIGDRATKLQLAQKIGIHVPRFAILSAEFIEAHRQDPTLLDRLYPNIQADLKSWNVSSFILRVSLEYGDEHLASTVANLNSKGGIQIENLKSAVLDFLSELEREDVKNFFRLHSGEKGENQRSAILIQEHIPTQRSGIYFHESPTISSGLHYIEAQTPSGLQSQEVSWCDSQGVVWKRNSGLENIQLSPTLIKNHIQWGKKLFENCQSNLSFEWIEDSQSKFYLLSWQTAASNNENLETYTRIPMKGLLIGHCSNLSTDLWKKIFNPALELLEKEQLPNQEKEERGLLEFFAGRPYLSMKRLLRILASLGIQPMDLGISHESEATVQRKYRGGIQQILRMYHMLKRHRVSHASARAFLESTKNLIEEHKNILEHLASSRDCARLIANLIDSMPNALPVFRNELGLLESKEMLFELTGTSTPNFPLHRIDSIKENASKSLKVFQAISELNHKLSENSEFVSSVESFLDSTSKSGQAGDIYYWLRENGFHEESSLIHEFLQNFGKVSFYDRRVESPCLMLSPTTFFQILMRLSRSPSSKIQIQSEENSAKLSFRSLVGKILGKKITQVLSESIAIRAEASELIDDALFVIRSALRNMAVLLQSEAPKLFPDQDIAPDLTPLNLDTIRDYGNGSFEADVLQQLLGRNVRTSARAALYPDQFQHRFSEGDPYFLNKDIAPENQKIQVIADPGQNFSGRLRILSTHFVDDPLHLGPLGEKRSELVSSEASIPGIALFVSSGQRYFISPQYDLDWVLLKLKLLDLKVSVLNFIPTRLRRGDSELTISLNKDQGVEFR